MLHGIHEGYEESHRINYKKHEFSRAEMKKKGRCREMLGAKVCLSATVSVLS